MEYVVAITVGVIAGVSANLISSFFINVWLPAYRNYVYQGIRVDGDWIHSHVSIPIDNQDFSDVWSLTITLKQKAYNIEGAATSREYSKSGNIIDLINYDIEGSIYDRFLFIYMRPKNKDRIAHSSFHLEVVGDGNKMIGYRSFYGLEMNSIRAIKCEWKRNNSNSE